MSVKNFVLGIGIIVVFALVLWQGIEAFYPSPQYDNFCDQPRVPKIVQTQQECVEEGGEWTPQEIHCITEPCPQGYCDLDANCRDGYDESRKDYAQTVFLISIIVAIITILIGYLILSVEPVGSALIGSGIWAVFWGTVINWQNFSTIWRFGLLLITLVLLIFIAYRLNTTNKKGFWRKLGLKK